MNRLWTLPPLDLNPLPQDLWAVQSQQGLGPAEAVFVPLVQKDGKWELALGSSASLPLTRVDDGRWTAVPFPPAMREATHYACLLRYDQPSERPTPEFFVDATGTVSAKELEYALKSIRDNLESALDVHLLEAGAAPGTRHARPRGEPELPSALCFAFASCQYPAGMLDRPVAYRSLQRLAAWLREDEGPEPERLLLLGDQVYIDATYGLLDPARMDDRYRIPYEDFTDRQDGPFASLPQDFLGRRRMTPDDHEIRDNWEPTLHGAWDRERDTGLRAFWQFQRRSAPPDNGDLHLQEDGTGWRLFMADTRTRRGLRDERTVATASILGDEQTRQLTRWLTEPDRGELKIVTCAAMLLPRTRMYLDEPLYLDAWQGFPASFHGLLALLCDHQVRNVVFLSGDAHLACDARVTVTRSDGQEVRFASLHAPALYAPYPFANEEPANLLLRDRFSFEAGGQDYVCEVCARVLAEGRSGCGLLRAERHGSQWSVGYEVLEPAPVA